MTLQDLKDNRNEIVNFLNNSAYDTKQVMTEMVKYIGFRGILSTNVIDYTKEVIGLAEIKTINAQEADEKYSKITETHYEMQQRWAKENRMPAAMRNF